MSEPLGIKLYELPDDLRCRVETAVGTLEVIRWIDQPIPHACAYRLWPVFIGGALFWLPFTAWWTLGALQQDESQILPLMSAPFWIAGGLMVASPWWMGQRAKRTVYVLTTSEAIVIRPAWFDLRTKRFSADDLTGSSSARWGDGSGSISFQSARNRDNSGSGEHDPFPDGFSCVRRVSEVLELVNEVTPSAVVTSDDG